MSILSNYLYSRIRKLFQNKGLFHSTKIDVTRQSSKEITLSPAVFIAVSLTFFALLFKMKMSKLKVYSEQKKYSNIKIHHYVHHSPQEK